MLSVLLRDALRTAGIILGRWCSTLNTNSTAVRASTMGLAARKGMMGGVWEVDSQRRGWTLSRDCKGHKIHLFSLLRRPALLEVYPHTFSLFPV